MSTPQNGVLIDGHGVVVAVMHGFSGAAPAGQTFVAVDISGVVAGQVAPSAASQALAATDKGMSRVVEDLAVALIGKGVLAHADLSAPVLAKINARRALRGQAAI